MTKEEFIQGLKEDKFFDNPEEHMNHRLPYVQFFVNNYVHILSQINGKIFDSMTAKIKTPVTDSEYKTLNSMFQAIKDLVLYNKYTIFAD